MAQEKFKTYIPFCQEWREEMKQKTKDQLIDALKFSLKKNQWINIQEQQPRPNTEVLIVCDYTAFGRSRKIYQANVYFSETLICFGGPNSLTGQGTLTGIYFAVPAIVNPKLVTHWRELPQFP